MRGASLAGAAVHGAKLRRAWAFKTRMAGMWSSDYEDASVGALADGSMPVVEPLAQADPTAMGWAREYASQVDAAKEAEEDAKDDAAHEAWQNDNPNGRAERRRQGWAAWTECARGYGSLRLNTSPPTARRC